MNDWDGRGLPPVAGERLARASRSGVRTSLLSAPAAVGLDSVGLEPVGEVMGCIVEKIGWQGWVGCGASSVGFGLFTAAPSTTVTTRQSRWASFRPYADAIRRGYTTALSRLLQEAAALGADGVVGIRLAVELLDGAREFSALGTAVRARSSVRPAHPFTTDLVGSDVAKLMSSGWVPAGLLVAFEVAIRHDDWQTYTQVGSWVNTEVTGYTELTQHVRGAVRTDIARQVRQRGAEGFVSSAITLAVREIEPGENHRDHVAEALMVGTAVARFDRSDTGARPGSLTVLPVGSRRSSQMRRSR